MFTKRNFLGVLGSFCSLVGLCSASVEDYYDIESIPLPEGEFSADAITFMPDGRLACVTSLSKIWMYEPESKEWSVFADGLHTPLGLLPVNDRELLVMQRPELTRLVDEDGDGVADRFETVTDDFGISGNYAEFAFGPVADGAGNLFIGLGTGSHYGKLLTNEVRGEYSPIGHWGRMNTPVPYRGWIMKVTPEGETIPYASGFREPNGFGFDGDGQLFSIDNQGDWVGTSGFYHVEDGGFYGHVPSLSWREDYRSSGKMPLDEHVEKLDAMRTRPAVVFPHGEMSNSPTQPLWLDGDARLPEAFRGQFLIGEMNFNRVMRVMLEEVGGELQGAVVPFIDDAVLHMGNNRLTLGPDGDLWVGQTKHQAWVGESGLQRIHWKGVEPMEIERMSAIEDGFLLRFTKPVDRKLAERRKVYSLTRYFYNYHEAYGSEKFDVEKARIQRVEVSEDGYEVRLRIKNLKPWRVYDLKLEGIQSADGKELLNPWIVYTLNRFKGRETPVPEKPLPVERPERRTPRLPEGGVQDGEG